MHCFSSCHYFSWKSDQIILVNHYLCHYCRYFLLDYLCINWPRGLIIQYYAIVNYLNNINDSYYCIIDVFVGLNVTTIIFYSFIQPSSLFVSLYRNQIFMVCRFFNNATS